MVPVRVNDSIRVNKRRIGRGACQGEGAVLALHHALINVRVEHRGDDKAGDDHDGVPGRADEPDHLVQSVQHAGFESIGLPRNQMDQTKFIKKNHLCGQLPSSPAARGFSQPVLFSA